MPDFLPDLPVDGILECLTRAPGNEIKSGKFDSPDSASALVANAFGWFLNRAADLPPLPGVPAGQVASVTLQAEMRFPWTGGRHHPDRHRKQTLRTFPPAKAERLCRGL
jgi:hypothetical protein